MKTIISSPPKLSEGWTHGERDSTKRSNRLRQNVDVSLDDPTPQELRQTLKEGFCWWCKRGGFRTVANHTSHAHGITARDIRNLARVTSEDSIATPEYSAYCKTRPQTLHCEKMLASDKHPDRPYCYTTEGLRRKQESVKKALEVFKSLGIISNPRGNPEQLRRATVIHQARLKDDPTYYKKWRKALSTTGRDKRIVAECPICHVSFKTYKTSNRKTCGKPECMNTLRSDITRNSNRRRRILLK